MLRADFMPATAQPALEQRERGFDCVGVGFATNVLFDAVLNHLVLESHSASDPAIEVEFVGEKNFDVLPQVLAHELLDGTSGHVLGVEQPEFAVPLPDTDDWPLLSSAPALGESLPATTDIGFVHFNLPVQHRLVALGHCRAD